MNWYFSDLSRHHWSIRILDDGLWPVKHHFIPFAITLFNYRKVFDSNFYFFTYLESNYYYYYYLATGGYVFLGGTGGQESSVSRLLSPPFSTGNVTQCFSFHFAMVYNNPNTTLVVYR